MLDEAGRNPELRRARLPITYEHAPESKNKPSTTDARKGYPLERGSGVAVGAALSIQIMSPKDYQKLKWPRPTT